MSILIVDDEIDVLEPLKTFLQVNGYSEIETAANGFEAWDKILAKKPDLVITDIIMPQMDGFQLCNKIKTTTTLADIAIIMLTAKKDEIDVILGLEFGADDYITKPFSLQELLARVKAVLRRTVTDKNENNGVFEFQSLKIDCLEHLVSYNEQKVFLTNKEFDLLKMFASNPKTLLSRNDIIDKVWSDDHIGDLRIVDLQVKNLRKKLKLVMRDEVYELIRSVRGKGYIFSPPQC